LAFIAMLVSRVIGLLVLSARRTSEGSNLS